MCYIIHKNKVRCIINQISHKVYRRPQNSIAFIRLLALLFFLFKVDFVSAHNKDAAGAGRLIRRPIYPMKSFIPSSKKVLSFTSFTEDFSMNVNYGEMRHLNADQLM